MHSLLAAARAELLQLETVGSVTTVLRRNVVALLALGAGQRDARTDVGALFPAAVFDLNRQLGYITTKPGQTQIGATLRKFPRFSRIHIGQSEKSGSDQDDALFLESSAPAFLLPASLALSVESDCAEASSD